MKKGVYDPKVGFKVVEVKAQNKTEAPKKARPKANDKDVQGTTSK